jgi:hypothetical protein
MTTEFRLEMIIMFWMNLVRSEVRSIRIVVTALIAFTAFAAVGLASMDTLSDAELVGRASAVLHVQQAPADRILGVHRGVAVIVDDRCGDVCPANTVRIIRYMIDPGPACTRIGGDAASIGVPIAVGITMQSFCVPHVLFQRKLYVGRPYQK